MQIKLLKEIVVSVVGNVGLKIVDLLYGQKNVNEFLIAKKLGLTINQTRNVLYKLADEGLVSFIRKKDSKKGGWYTYFWTLNSGKSLGKLRDKLEKLISESKEKLSLRRAGRFYICKNCHIEYNEEQALLNNYVCPECGETVDLKDNTAEIGVLEKDISKWKSILEEVNQELGIIEIEDQKIRARKVRSEQKKKDKERLLRRKEKERLMKKEERKKKDGKGKKMNKRNKRKKSKVKKNKRKTIKGRK